MIGNFKIHNLLTYIGLIISVLGMCLANQGYINYAMICLILSAICDLFDGMFANIFNRSEQEKTYGIELDSLCDVINFIVLPIYIILNISNSTLVYFVVILFAVFGVSRLAYFNSNSKSEDKYDYFLGIPVTYVALFIPPIYLITSYFNLDVIYLVIAMLIIGILFVVKLKNNKPGLIMRIFYIFLSIGCIVLLCM